MGENIELVSFILGEESDGQLILKDEGVRASLQSIHKTLSETLKEETEQQVSNFLEALKEEVREDLNLGLGDADALIIVCIIFSVLSAFAFVALMCHKDC